MNQYDHTWGKILLALSKAMDMVSRDLSSHHQQVAYMSYRIAEALDIPEEDCCTILMAGALHDIGALPIVDSLEELVFENVDQEVHARLGADILLHFKPFKKVALLVEHHHTQWRDHKQQSKDVPLGAYIVHLADHVSRMYRKDVFVLDQRREIIDAIVEQCGILYPPEIVDAFRGVSDREAFWLDIGNDRLARILQRVMTGRAPKENMDDIEGLARLFSLIIDFRSRFTATHSSGVSSTSGALAKAAGFSETDCTQMRIAGHLHDVGKLAVPRSILEKAGRLDPHEFNIIKSHTYWTYKILEDIDSIKTINTWAAFHHERIDGKGYPYRLEDGEICLGSRIMAVADVFTAITEDRPYRPGMDMPKATAVLEDMVRNGALDSDVYGLLKDNITDINQQRIAAQSVSRHDYMELFEGIAK